ncbi:MAG: BACON domain-containing protein [Alistipes sp.]|nr:BACON domain-containing protein [Alistipes sp.]
MRNFRRLLAFVAVASTLIFASCQPNSPVDVDDTSVSVVFPDLGENSMVEIDSEGGEVSVDYVINNGIEGIDIVATAEAEWISDIVVGNGAITFNVAKNNNTEARDTRVRVAYPNADTRYITVKQLSFDAITFELELTESTSTSCTTLVKPSNDNYAYIAYMAEVDYFLTANITTAEELFQDDYKYYMAFAEQYNVPYLYEFFLANYVAYEGEQSIQWTGMMPDKEYVLYVYAIEFNEANNDYYMASPITYQLVTLSGENLSEVTFDVDVDVNGPNVSYTINPENWDGRYYLTVYEQGDYLYRDTPADEDYSKLISSVWLDMMSQLMASGYSVDQLMQLMCLQGPESYSELLKGSTNYALVIYAVDMVDGLPQVVSVPQIVNFTTGEVGASSMVIDIKLENKYVRVADVIITPSTNDPYTVAIVAKNEVPDKSDEEIIEWLHNSFYMESYQGEIRSHINSFKPETEYSILAYGYYGGVVTTELFRLDFVTDAESECENSVLRVDFNGPYSLLELELYDPDYFYNYGMFESMGWYAMWAEIFTEKPSQDLFYCIYSAQEIAVYGEQEIFEDLVSYACGPTQLLTGQNDMLYVMCAVTMDYRGNFSDMWMSEPFMFNYNEQTKLPLEEIISKIFGSSTQSAKPAKLQLMK